MRYLLTAFSLLAFSLTTALAEEVKKPPAKPQPAHPPVARTPAPAVHAPAQPQARPPQPQARPPQASTQSNAHPSTLQQEHREHREAVREVERRDVAREAARERHVFHERNVHRFNQVELGHWRGGRWNNTCFGGRCGWWWFAGGQWYFYTRPVYPYPVVVSEQVFLEPEVAVAAPIEVAPAFAPAPAPVIVVPRPARAPLPIAAPSQFWYYCDDPPGYYPSVPNCNTAFREVGAPAAPR